MGKFWTNYLNVWNKIPERLQLYILYSLEIFTGIIIGLSATAFIVWLFFTCWPLLLLLFLLSVIIGVSYAEQEHRF